MRAGLAGDDGLVCVPESAAGCVSGVDVGLRFGGAQEFDVGFLVVGFVEEDSLRGCVSEGEIGMEIIWAYCYR